MDKINKLYILCLVFLVMTPFINSMSYAQGRTINLSASCEDINCSDSNVYVTVLREGYLELDNGTATRMSGYVYYPFLTNSTGEHQVYFSSPTSVHAFDFEVNPSEDSLETGESIIYILILLFAISIFTAFIYGGIKIPWQKYKVDIEGIPIGVNQKKLWKIICWVLAYFSGLWVFAIAKGIVDHYLYLELAIFDWIYWILLAFAMPVFIVGIIIGIITFVQTKKITKWMDQQTKFG